MRLRRLLVVALLLVLGAARVPACLAEPQSMVAAANPMAVEAGLEVLRRGGSAVDAAIAVQMVLGVVEPQASGLGGGGFLLNYEGATGTIDVYDGRETAPAGATPTMFLGVDGKPLSFREAVASGISVGVPGALAMLELAHKEQGKLAWSELFQPAIKLARDGFDVPPRLADWLQKMPSLRDDPGLRATYFNADGSPKKLGEKVVNTALAETMQQIADQGTKVLYEGPIAAEMVERVHDHVRPGHPVAGRPRRLPAGQARAGVRALSRLDRLRHAAAFVGRHRHPAGAGVDRAVRHLARSAQQPARASSHRRGEPARLRRPRPLRRRSGVRVGARGRAAVAGLYRRTSPADVGGPQHGRGRPRPAARLCRARHQPHHASSTAGATR